MVKKQVFIVTIALLLAVILVQEILLNHEILLVENPVTTSENAVIIAKAALLQKYGERAIYGKSFDAFIDASNPEYWQVSELNMLGYPPHVLVRRSDGKAILHWED